MSVGVGDVVRCVAEWDMPSGTIAQLVYHYLGVSGTTATEAQVGAAVEAQLDLAFDEIAASIANLVVGSTIEGLLWDFALNRWDGIFTVPLIGADGASAGQPQAHGAAGLVKIFTTANRRQGRKYIHGIGESLITNGLVEAVMLTDLALFATELDDDIVAGGLTLSFGTFNTEPSSPLFETFSVAAQSVIAEAIVAYQRRRKPGTGI